MKRSLLLLALMLLCAVTSVMVIAQQPQQYYSLYSDHKARKPGDLLTVVIVEFTEAENKAETNTKSDDASSLAAKGSGALDFIPDMGFSGSIGNSYTGSGSNSRTGSLKSKITVKIDSILPGGAYQVSGTRMLNVNNEKQIMSLSGLVRARDIQPDNTIYSYQIADASITYKGRGIVEAAHKPGIVRRILNWIF
ncbi:MAG: flagellar basal body L-ring protein FlgH [Calditrichota bacterium]